jgi:membrane-associated protein
MEFLLGMDLSSFIRTVGLLGIFGIVFVESGILVGLFLPGDSLLVTAGLLASQGFVDVRVLMLVVFLGAVLGDSMGYAFGKNVGPRVFTREESFFFRKSYLARAQEFYTRHGGKTIVLARFLPVVRTFVPVLAGVGRMHYQTFLFYNIAGGLLWAVGLTGLGYFLGNVIPNLERYLVLIILLVIIASFLPPLVHIFKSKERRGLIAKFFVFLRERFWGK